MEVPLNILLEFLYNRFAVTFLMCLFGSFIRELLKSNKNKDEENKQINIKKVLISSIFSSFLVCACAKYLELQFEMYLLLSILCGMYGMSILKIVLNEGFMGKLIPKMIKNIANPIIKSAVESAEEIAKENDKNEDKNKPS